ncbi:hypothetical protein IE81DRAFT_361919 [Ceraceosorus guamensis]|uniref:Uncharacterized protein n=1 Tax=Ceraceosorus guamensis TaxID=1522189 RepID=A0A316VRK4_9BASI|nr:hypothetical protein IE81DRAFT_361919 [Ceraceosorus guamensis]PWN40227.1 hypothetical protein IE81DRAFT_361919 [Ceraceosorus guamensis]
MSPPTPAVVGQVPKIQVSVADNSTWRLIHDLDSAGEPRPWNESLASSEALRYALALECHRTTMGHQCSVFPVRPSRARSLTYSGSVGSTIYDLRPPLQGAYAALAQAQANGEVPYLDQRPYQHSHAQEQTRFQPGQGPTIQSSGITLAAASDATALQGSAADRGLDALSGWMTTPLPSATEAPSAHRPLSPSSNFAPILDVGPARRRSSTISAATIAFLSPVLSHGRLATSPSIDSHRSLYIPGATPTAPSPIPQPWLDTGMATTCDALSSSQPLELPVTIMEAPPNFDRSNCSDMTEAFSIPVSEKQSNTPHGAASLPTLSQDGHEHAMTLDVPLECSLGWPASVARPGRARPPLRLSLPDDINNAVSQTLSVRSHDALSTDSMGQDVDLNLRSPSESSSESSNLHTRSPIEPRVTSCKSEGDHFRPLLSQARRSIDWSAAHIDIGAVDPLQELFPSELSHNGYAQPESSQIEASLEIEEPAISLADSYAQQYAGPADPELQHVALHRQLKHFISTAPMALQSPTAVSAGILAPGMSLLDPLDLIAYSRSNYLTQPIEANDLRRLETVTDPDFIWHQSLQDGSDHLGEVSSILSSISIHRFMLPVYDPPAATNVEQRKHKPKVSQSPVVAFSWRGDIWITACVIIRILVFRLRVVGYDILNLNKLSE